RAAAAGRGVIGGALDASPRVGIAGRHGVVNVGAAGQPGAVEAGAIDAVGRPLRALGRGPHGVVALLRLDHGRRLAAGARGARLGPGARRGRARGRVLTRGASLHAALDAVPRRAHEPGIAAMGLAYAVQRPGGTSVAVALGRARGRGRGLLGGRRTRRRDETEAEPEAPTEQRDRHGAGSITKGFAARNAADRALSRGRARYRACQARGAAQSMYTSAPT